MLTNVHVHLFSADHTPPAQLYYLLRGALYGAARKLLPKILGRAVTMDDVRRLERSMDRFEWPWPIIFQAAIGGSALAGGLGLVNPGRLVGMFTAISRITPREARAILGMSADEREADLLQGMMTRTKALKDRGVLYPFRDALCEMVAALFAAHDRGVKKSRPVTQEDLWKAFLASPGAEQYRQVVVLSVNFDESFLEDDLPGLGSPARSDFAAQMRELEDLARKQNAKGGVQIVPFLGIDPRGHSADSMDAFVRERVGKTMPWKGLKVYPPMGFLPGDDRLRRVFDYCQDFGIPVLSHCSSGGAGVRGTERNYADLAHPMKWEGVLARLEQRSRSQETGKFRLCLAHFDSLEAPDDVSWCDEIMTLMQRFDGTKGVEVYSDIAFDVVRGEARTIYAANVKRVQGLGIANRVLFGSDWWNFLFDCDSEQEFIDLLEIDRGWWKSADFEAAASAFLADVAGPVAVAQRRAVPRRRRARARGGSREART